MTGVGPVVLLASVSVAYVLGVVRVRRQAGGGHRGRAWPAARSAAFGAGIVVLGAALLSAIDARAEVALSAHMIQHLLITAVAAPLIVAGAPLSLALQATRGDVRAALAAAVRSRAVRLLTTPVVAFTLFALATLATHLPAFYDAALRSAPLHALEHLIFLSTAVLFWLPVIGANPVHQVRSWAGRTIYLLAAMPAMTLVGVVLVASADVRYGTYAQTASAAGVDALRDQQAAGSLMWVGGAILFSVALLVLGFQSLIAEERRQQARDALAADGGGRA